MGYFVSFLVKIWVGEAPEGGVHTEGLDAGILELAWRGQVHHIRSGDVAPFTCHEEMLEFIRTHLAAGEERSEEDAW